MKCNNTCLPQNFQKAKQTVFLTNKITHKEKYCTVHTPRIYDTNHGLEIHENYFFSDESCEASACDKITINIQADYHYNGAQFIFS
jgi:hypothetical protein